MNAAYKDSDGKLWFGTTLGVTCYNPGNDIPRSTPPKMYISKVHLHENDEIRVLHDINNADFSYNQNYFRFDFIGIDLANPDKVNYRYRLKGLDNNWTSTTDRFIQYTSLDDEEYQFEVKARNEWGIWSETASVSFTINPPFWETWWFRSLWLIIILALFWSLHRFRLEKALAIERIRLKIAGDLHDEIGAVLTQISLQSDLLQANTSDVAKRDSYTKRIATLSRDVIKMFSDIVWSIDSRNDFLGDLISRMQDLALNMLKSRKIDYSFEYQGIDINKKISADVRQNVFLIYKEAINNIIKHSNAKVFELL